MYPKVLLTARASLVFSIVKAQTANFLLGKTSVVVGPAMGTNSVVLSVTPVTAQWTNSANASWLHLNSANQTGKGSTNLSIHL